MYSSGHTSEKKIVRQEEIIHEQRDVNPSPLLASHLSQQLRQNAINC